MANQAENTQRLNANLQKLNQIADKVDLLVGAGGGTGDVQPELQTAIDDNIAKTDEIATRLEIS